MVRLGSAVFLLVVVGGVAAQKVGDRCFHEPTNSVGRCKNPQQCPIAEQDYASTGIRPTFCEYSIRRVLVCCREVKSPPASPPPPPPPQHLSQPGKKRVSERKCDEFSKAVVHQVDFINLLPEPETMSILDANCNYTGVELIVGGVDALQGEFPHMAAVGWPSYDDSYAFHCGGSLISKRFVMTAGHCIKKPREGAPTIVRLGEQNLDPNVKDGAHPVDIRIKKIHKHPEYRPPARYNDIALLELEKDVEFNNDIRPACLWAQPDFSIHKKALATGWGVTDPNDPLKTSKELQKVSLSLFTNMYCSRILRGNRYWDGFVPSQMCAGELRDRKDTCQGDSGSPLQVVSQENQCVFYVVGVTSFGGKCAQSGQPAVYTRVSSFFGLDRKCCLARGIIETILYH